MAYIEKKDSIFYVTEETTEGTAVAPASATDGYFQAREDGIEINPGRELLERALITSTLTKADPRQGMKTADGSVGVEYRGSGTEGSAPDWGYLLESLLGAKRAITDRVTTKATGNTGSVLAIEDADIADFTVGDGIVILQTGGHHVAHVTEKVTTMGSATITVTPAKAAGTWANSVVIAKATTYYTTDTTADSYTFGAYWGDAQLEQITGARTSGMTLENFTAGQIPSLGFSMEGMSYAHTASSSAAHTPTYNSALPPVVLDAKIYKAGTAVCVNELALSIEQPITFLNCTGEAAGRKAGRLGQKRSVTGSLAPYADDASVANWTNWDNGTAFSLVVRAYVPSGTAGEFSLGTVVSIYLPNCITTSVKHDDLDGVLRENIEFMATGGVTGVSGEIYMSFV